MKKGLLLIIAFFTLSISGYTQEERAEYDMDELYEMIKDEPSNLFELSNAYITFSNTRATHTYDGKLQVLDTIFIDKGLVLENVMFDSDAHFSYVKFKEYVKIKDSWPINIDNCQFQKKVDITIGESFVYKDITKYRYDFLNMYFKSHNIRKSLFLDGCRISIAGDKEYISEILISENEFYTPPIDRNNMYLNNSRFYFHRLRRVTVNNNIVRVDSASFAFNVDSSKNVLLYKNDFTVNPFVIDVKNQDNLEIYDNIMPDKVFINIPQFQKNDYINWSDINSKAFSLANLDGLRNQDFSQGINWLDSYDPKLIDSLTNDLLLTSQFYFDKEMAFKGDFLDHFKRQHNKQSANEVFIEMKNMETARLKFLYKESPTFDTYFSLKLNQFLYTFAKYGTKPARALTISVYTIFLFACFYVFFPNSWDESNRNRIMKRMLFFAKYFRKSEGMSDVYENDNQKNVQEYDHFRNYIESSRDKIPPYFMTLARPVYNLAIANYSIGSRILKNADILNGKWVELNPKRKRVTSIIMGLWLFLIIIFEVFRRFFNALMLSINTFSTLGFGEIPIKGLPRYLAIIQGFIGWFMLSIFSVALISQLLG